MKKMLIFSLLVFILLAGCIRQPPAKPTGVGVIITSFSPELPEIEPGTDIIVSILVKNTGGAVAKNVNVELLGLTAEWKIDGVSPPTDEQRWKRLADVLYPADPERGMPEGQEGYKEWKVTGPAKGVTQTYDISARVYYDYNTTSNILMRVLSLDYYRALSPEQQRTVERGIISSVYTAGPLVVTARAPQPLVTVGITVPIQFEIQNVGGGRTFTAYGPDRKHPDAAKLDEVIVHWSIPGVTGAKCADSTTSPVTIRLIQGKSARLFCSMPVGAIATYSDFSIKLELQYKYFIETASSITVLKALA